MKPNPTGAEGTAQKSIDAVVEYYYAWDQVRRITSELRSRRCDFEERGDEFTSGTPRCYHDNRMANEEDGSPKLDEWCDLCKEGYQMYEDRKDLTRTMRLKLDVIRRLGKRLAATPELQETAKS